MGKLLQFPDDHSSSNIEASFKVILKYVTSSRRKRNDTPPILMSDIINKNHSKPNQLEKQQIEETTFTFNPEAASPDLITQSKPEGNTLPISNTSNFDPEKISSPKPKITVDITILEKTSQRPLKKKEDQIKITLERLSENVPVRSKPKQKFNKILAKEENIIKQPLPLADTNYFSPKNPKNVDDEKLAEIVHELVLQKFKQSYRHVADKLRKINLSTIDSRSTITKPACTFKVEKLQNIVNVKQRTNEAPIRQMSSMDSGINMVHQNVSPAPGLQTELEDLKRNESTAVNCYQSVVNTMLNDEEDCLADRELVRCYNSKAQVRKNHDGYQEEIQSSCINTLQYAGVNKSNTPEKASDDIRDRVNQFKIKEKLAFNCYQTMGNTLPFEENKKQICKDSPNNFETDAWQSHEHHHRENQERMKNGLEKGILKDVEDYFPSVEEQNQYIHNKLVRLLSERKTYNKSTSTPCSSENTVLTSSMMELPSQNTYLEPTKENKDVTYDEHTFLKEALGEELLQEASSEEYIIPSEKRPQTEPSYTASIGTDDISALISSTSTIANSRKQKKRNGKSETLSSLFQETKYEDIVYEANFSSVNTSKTDVSALYSTVRKPENKGRGAKKNSATISKNLYSKNNTFSSYPSYEEVTDFVEEEHRKNDELQHQILVQESIIEQCVNILAFGRRNRRFIGSLPHLEAERILLVSKIRKEALINSQNDHQRTPDDQKNILGKITIQNIECAINMSAYQTQPIVNHYVCVVHNNTTVYSTKIATPNTLGEIDFGGQFLFDNLTSDFDIKLEMYSLQLNEELYRVNCFNMPFLRNSAKLPMLALSGQLNIGIANVKNQIFPLKNADENNFTANEIYATIDTSIKMPKTVRGFLTIGIETNGHPTWNRRWCVLENDILKYFNYPSDENYCEPIGIIALKNCVSCRETSTKYLKQKTMLLKIEKTDVQKNVFVSADNTSDFKLWIKHIDLVLRIIKEWRLY